MKKNSNIKALLCFTFLLPLFLLKAQYQSLFIYDPSGNHYQSLLARLPYFFQGNIVRISALDSTLQNYHAGFLLDPSTFNQTQINFLKTYLNLGGRIYMYGFGNSTDLLTFLGFEQIIGFPAVTCVDTTVGLTGTFTEGLNIYQPILSVGEFIIATGTIFPILQARCPAAFNHFSAFASVSDTFKTVVDIYNYTYDGNFLKRLLMYFDLYVIPVELISFGLVDSEGKIILKWITATETNNKGFEIERKGNEQTWNSIGFVSGNGTTTDPNYYSYEDKNLSNGKYEYRLKQIDYDGSFEHSNVILVEIGVPSKFELHQNYPNPFNPSTKIRFTMPDNVETRHGVSLRVYDILGREIATLLNEEKPAGSYEVEFDGSYLSSGLYIYTLKSGSYFLSKKMIYLK